MRSRAGTGNSNFRHGHAVSGSETPEYRTWQSMVKRCANPKAKKWPRYGGRGIEVCERWREFSNFIADMGLRPTPKHTIDRKDNDGNYEPTNCRWATNAEQSRNRRSNRLLTFRGETACLQDWADRLGMSRSVIKSRLKRGWSVDAALGTPALRVGEKRGRSERMEAA